MTMYTVVVCSNCKHTWIVKDRPERSQCRKCRKTRLFSKLKKYYQDDDLEAAQLARAHAQAKVNDQEERFQDALDRGVLDQEIQSVFGEDEFAEKKGIDKEELRSEVEDLIESPTTSLSQREIIKDAIQKQANPSLDEFIAYVDDRGVDTDKAVLHLEKLVRSGRLSLPTSIGLPEIEAKGYAAIDKPDDSEQERDRGVSPTRERNEEDGSKESSSSSHRELLLSAAGEHEPDVEAVIDSAVESGITREKAVLGLEKLLRSGEIVSLNLGEVEEAVEETLGSHDEQASEAANSEPTPEPTRRKNEESEEDDSEGNEGTNRSRREIMEDAIRETDGPTEEDVVEYAVSNGIGEKKARKYLEKMVRSGDVMQSTGGTLRLI